MENKKLCPQGLRIGWKGVQFKLHVNRLPGSLEGRTTYSACVKSSAMPRIPTEYELLVRQLESACMTIAPCAFQIQTSGAHWLLEEYWGDCYDTTARESSRSWAVSCLVWFLGQIRAQCALTPSGLGPKRMVWPASRQQSSPYVGASETACMDSFSKTPLQGLGIGLRFKPYL